MKPAHPVTRIHISQLCPTMRSRYHETFLFAIVLWNPGPRPYYHGAQMPDIVITHDALIDFGRRILKAARVPEDSAEVVAVSLGASNLRGVDSHGFQLLPFYMR